MMRQEAAPPIVELKDVDKRYGDGPLSTPTVDGDRVYVLAGCGKSTILRLISGLSPVSAGRIAVDPMSPAGDAG